MMQKAQLWGRLPADLKALPQWAVAGASKAPMALGADNKLRNVSVTRPSEWMSFDQACRVAWDNRELVTTHTTHDGRVITKVGLDIGFILVESDKFSCIDLDVKDATTHPDKPKLWTTPDDFQFYTNIVKHFDSYTERSTSGKGLHIWVEGNIGRGFKRGGVEVYSQERFIICTGDAWVNKPVADRDIMLRNMVTQMRPVAVTIELEELDAVEDDWAVLDKAYRAANSDKFIALWKGRWADEGYPSQSEADLSLMSMLAFYSPSNEQCRRLFKESGLAREKTCGKSSYHLNRILKIIRQRQEREANVEFGAIMKAAEAAEAGHRAEIQRLQGGVPAAQGIQTPFGVQEPRVVIPLTVEGQGDPIQPPPAVEGAMAQLAPVSAGAAAAGETGLPWPPGFLGALARFIYANSFIPVKEVSIVAALGLMAGICGKAWHIPQSGLNLYIILVARSAIGKEAMHNGISTLMRACLQKYPHFANFISFDEYASGPALVKAVMACPSFVNVSGEMGRRLKRMALEDGREGPMMTLRTQLTNLYQKSGPQSVAGGIGYSSVENNVQSVSGAAYSMIGETTPSTFYQSLTESMMEDGFLSRFLVVGYDGDRPDENPEILETPDDTLRDHLVFLAGTAFSRIAAGSSQAVQRTEAASKIAGDFSKEAVANIRKTDDESRRQMWNRAALKALRIAALLAVGDNPSIPVVDVQHITWAIEVVRRDIAMMQQRLQEGDVGSSDVSRQKKLMAVIKDYRDRQGPMPKSYKVDERMRENQTVTKSFLQQRVQNAAVFYNHKQGISYALDQTIQQCVANGYLMEVKGDKLSENYNFHGRAWRILDIPDYDAMSKEE